MYAYLCGSVHDNSNVVYQLSYIKMTCLIRSRLGRARSVGLFSFYYLTMIWKSVTCTDFSYFPEPCPKGRYFAGGETCTECPIGQYRDTDRTPECKDCPEGMTTETNGSVSLDNCTRKHPLIFSCYQCRYMVFFQNKYYT